MTISKKDAMEFPFLRESSNLAKEMGFLSDLDKIYVNAEVQSYVDDYLSEVYYGRFYMHKPTEDFWHSRVRFLGACIVINQVGKERAMHRFAEFEARHFALKVEHKSKEMFPIYFNIVFGEVWGRPNFIERTADGRFYAVKVTDFLKFKRKAGHALVNQYVVGGFAIISRDTLMHILQVGLEHCIYDRVKNMFRDVRVRKPEGDNLKETRFGRGVVLPQKLVDMAKKFEYVDLHMNVYKAPPDKDLKEYDTERLREKVVKLKGTMPPCMAFLMRKFHRGEHVPHFERFTLMTFMLARQDPESEILGLFERALNYKKDEIDYLLSHTKKTGYKTPNCSKIEDNNFCFRSSACGSCRNPLQLLGEV